MRVLLLLLAIPILSCGETCPDLAIPAVTLEQSGLTNTDAVTVTINREGGPTHESRPLHSLFALARGRYSLTFIANGSNFETLTGVCTAGYLSGCDAEDADFGANPTITIRYSGGVYTAELTTNGTGC